MIGPLSDVSISTGSTVVISFSILFNFMGTYPKTEWGFYRNRLSFDAILVLTEEVVTSSGHGTRPAATNQKSYKFKAGRERKGSGRRRDFGNDETKVRLG